MFDFSPLTEQGAATNILPAGALSIRGGGV